MRRKKGIGTLTLLQAIPMRRIMLWYDVVAVVVGILFILFLYFYYYYLLLLFSYFSYYYYYNYYIIIYLFLFIIIIITHFICCFLVAWVPALSMRRGLSKRLHNIYRVRDFIGDCYRLLVKRSKRHCHVFLCWRKETRWC